MSQLRHVVLDAYREAKHAATTVDLHSNR
jgi:hypothetical protein